MTETATRIDLPPAFPDHTQLPESDGTFVFAERAGGKNFQEHPQSIILTDSIGSVLQQLHPDSHYAIGQDCGIYWRETDPQKKVQLAKRGRKPQLQIGFMFPMFLHC